ncbi:MAG: protein-tyrosine-phosphatase [Bacteroidota bacterium]
MVFPRLAEYISHLSDELAHISPERKAALTKLSRYISQEMDSQKEIPLIFICTHNSRRSHMGQIWAQVFAWQYGIPLATFSGGTEATAFNPNAIAALIDVGLDIRTQDTSANPHYRVQVGPEHIIKEVFSKKFGDSPNPTSGFGAIMTCTDADEACPFVPGAKARFSLPYEDPKRFDGTDLQAKMYAGRSRQIAAEMKYVMDQVGKG